MISKLLSARASAISRLSILVATIGLGLMSSSCERDITLDLERPDPKIVVHGIVETDSLVRVSLSWNEFVFGEIDYSDLDKYFIQGATVTVSDGITTETLGPAIEFYNYTVINYKSSTMRGVTGRTYTLSVKYNGYDLEAKTSLPSPAPLDSFFFKPVLNPKTAFDSSAMELHVAYNDPDTSGNFVRVFTKRNSEPMWSSAFQNVYSDDIINGGDISFLVDRGKEPFTLEMDSPEFDEYGPFTVGDTVYMKWASIDRPAYNFWYSLTLAGFNVGNPFATPTPVVTNVKAKPGSKGQGLGVFVGYSIYQLEPKVVKR